MSESRAEVLDTAGPSSARQPRQYGFSLLPALAITVGVAVVIIGVAYAVLTSLLPSPVQPTRVSHSVTLAGIRGPIEVTYALPDTLNIDITDEHASPTRDGTPRAVMGFTHGGTGLYGLGEIGAQEALFNVAARGVVVADVTDTKGHGLRGGDPGHDAVSFVTGLNASEVWEVHGIAETTLGGFPAIRGRITLVENYWSHLDTIDGSGTLVELGPPSEIIVADVGTMTVLVQIWAGTDAALDAWIPTAMDLVDSLRFGSPD